MVKPRRTLVRKNFLASFFVSLLLWLSWLTIFFFVPPEYTALPFVFLVLTFLAVLFTTALVFANTRRGLLIAGGMVVFMVLRYFEIGNYLNLLLLAGLLLSIEYYLSSSANSH